MTAITLRLQQADYRKAGKFVLAHLRRNGETLTSARPLAIILYTLYSTALFIIIEAPTNLDPGVNLTLRLAVATLVFLPVLF